MSKIFICADIEGTAGVQAPLELQKGQPLYHGPFASQMTREVGAACKGAMEGGASTVWIKDSHGAGDNLIPSELPIGPELIRGWGIDPLHMMYGLKPEFDGVFQTGCHSAGGADTSPLAHTNNSKNNWVKINGEIVGEAYINSLTAAFLGVPTLLITGDAGICHFMKEKIPMVETVVTNTCEGNAVRCAHPERVIEQIRQAACRAMDLPRECCYPAVPRLFEAEICFRNHLRAKGAAFYPGARRTGTHTVAFSHSDWYEVLRFFFFTLGDYLV